MSKRARDRVGAIALLVFVGSLWVQRSYMTPFGGMFPDLVMAILAGILVVSFVLSFTSRAAAGAGDGGTGAAKPPAARTNWTGMAVVGALLLAWGALLRPLGFAVTGVLGFTAISWYLAGPSRGLGALARSAFVAAIVTGVLMAVFGWLLQVPLPGGTIFS